MSTSNEKESAKTDVAALQQAFDQVFALPDPPPASETDDFVAIRVGGCAFVLRVGELAWVETHRKIVSLPGSHAWLLGLVSTRGQFVPVYSLELVLGLPATAAVKPWIAIAAGQQFGIAFEVLEGYFRIPRANILGEGTTEEARVRTQQAVRVAGEVRPIVQLPVVFASIQDRVLSKIAAAQE